MTTFVRVARAWLGDRWAEAPTIAIDHDRIAPVSAAPSRGSVGRDGSVDPVGPVEPVGPVASIDATLLPPLTDAHVHIGLSDFAEQGGGGLARVLDLGWDPATMPAAADSAVEVVRAGTFLTAPGGYPSTRSWAPAGSVTPVATVAEAVAAVDANHAQGAAVIKVTLNSQAGPVLPDDVLRAICRRAHELGRPVVAHVEGAGQPARALLCGVDWFAHAPWTHRLGDDELSSMVGRVGWISTLDMHGRGDYGEDYARAVDNLRRFAALGGTVVYGTDLGNAIERTDLNGREVAALRAAGVTGERLLAALTGAPLLPRWSRTVTLLPASVATIEDAIDALPQARPADAATLMGLLS